MLYRVVLVLRFAVQVVVLRFSRMVHRGGPDRHGWIVGPYEIAGMVHRVAVSVPEVRSVILARHAFYDWGYDWQPSARSYPFAGRLRYWLLGPWKLGELSRSSRGIIYVSADGFLNAEYDQRDFEFGWLRAHGVEVVCLFTGNDIRSPALMHQLELESGRPNIATYLGDVNRVFATAAYDDLKRRVARSANRHASAVVNADLDQRGYLERPSEPFLYFHPDDEVLSADGRFDSEGPWTVVHAPSSPIIKGTQLVRAAVDQLRSEGYEFVYVELNGVSHAEVIRVLSGAHIALNEFYSYVPGVFGVEAMASGCALITSADEHLDPELPRGSNRAWLSTPHYAVAQSLRTLLDDHERARSVAREGVAWVRKNAVASVSGPRLAAVLDRTWRGDQT